MHNILLVLMLLGVSGYCAPKPASSAYEASPARTAALKGVLVAEGLDTSVARRYYQEGDFDRAIPILEAALKSTTLLDHEDSLFIFKHLGVMYAANETTRELGKYYMLQLLRIEPTARIMDMYASDMIYMIFRNIQEEFATAQAKLERAQFHLAGNRTEEKAKVPARPEPEKHQAGIHSRRTTYYWVGAVTVMAGVGLATYVLTREQPVATKSLQVD